MHTACLRFSQHTCLILLLVTAPLSMACGGSPKLVSPTTGRSERATQANSVAPQPEPVLLEKDARATTRETALPELSVEVASYLVGPSWVTMLENATFAGKTWPSWLINNQVVTERKSGDWVATLSKAHVEQALNEFASSNLPTQHLTFPASWQTTLVPALIAERAWFVCQRKQELIAILCEHPAPLSERLAVTGLISNLSLEKVLPDGLPVRESGAVLWPLEVKVLSHSQGQIVGVGDVPIKLVSTPNEPTVNASPVMDEAATASTKSDARGFARFDITRLDTPLHVNISSQTLVGPFASLTELPNLVVTTRALDATRQAVVAMNTAQNSAPNGFGAALVRELSLVYGKPLPTLDADLTRAIVKNSQLGPIGTTALPPEVQQRIVATTRGAVDYVVLVAGETEFASPMGADRTWYQARARAHLVEVWSGQVLAHFDETATGSGFGDQAAEQAALAAAVQKVRTRLQAWRTQ